MFLDQLLSDRHYSCTCKELVMKINDMLVFNGFKPIYNGDPEDKVDMNRAKRLIQLDIIALQDAPFNIEIDSSEKRNGAPVYRYKDMSHTLFAKQISDDEKKLLCEVLNSLGNFSGLDSFEWLDELRERLRDRRSFGNAYLQLKDDDHDESKSIIMFEENKDLKNKKHLPILFKYIANRKTIIIGYKKFNDSEVKHFSVYPYKLKQYANRWYLLATPAPTEEFGFRPDLILNLPLDRIEENDIVVDTKNEFRDCAVDLEERYEEIIGVTYYADNPIEKIILAVKESAYPYIETKPLHMTQKKCLDEQYQIPGYETISIECRQNHELISTILQYGDEIIVLAPTNLRHLMIQQLEKQISKYKDKEYRICEH